MAAFIRLVAMFDFERGNFARWEGIFFGHKKVSEGPSSGSSFSESVNCYVPADCIELIFLGDSVKLFGRADKNRQLFLIGSTFQLHISIDSVRV